MTTRSTGMPDASALLKLLPVGILVSRIADGSVTYANSRALAILDIDEDQLPGLSTVSFYRDADDREAMVEALRRHGHLDDVEVEITAPDGRTMWLRSSATLSGEGDDAVAVVAFADITHEHVAERQLRAYYRMEAFRRIAGGLAHEVNNALLPIITFGELTMEHVEPGGTAHKNLERIVQAGNRCAEAVARVTEFAHADAGARERIDLRGTVSRAADLLRAVTTRRVEVVAELPEEPVEVLGDPVALQENAFNVALGAADAYGGDHGTVTLTLSTCEVGADHGCSGELAPGRYARLDICDSGAVLDARAIEQVFDAAAPVHASGNARAAGLRLLRFSVIEHDGTVRIDGAARGGNRVSVLLPLAPAGEAAVSGGTR